MNHTPCEHRKLGPHHFDSGHQQEDSGSHYKYGTYNGVLQPGRYVWLPSHKTQQDGQELLE